MRAYKRISFFMAGILVVVLHALAFILGIGIVSVLFKMAGRRLLSQRARNSTWEPVSGSGDVSRMY